MSDTTFVAGTVVTKEWLNDVNDQTYGVPISLKLHGAVGDGVTDDSAAILSAITSATAGSVLVGEPGKAYKINNSISVNKSLTFSGITFKLGANVSMFTLDANDIHFDRCTFVAADCNIFNKLRSLCACRIVTITRLNGN